VLLERKLFPLTCFYNVLFYLSAVLFPLTIEVFMAGAKKIRKGTFVRILQSGVYRSVASLTPLASLGGASDTLPLSYEISQDAIGIWMSKAPGAPDLHAVDVEYGDNQTVMIEVPDSAFELIPTGRSA
jgi:hypothetical protein